MFTFTHKFLRIKKKINLKKNEKLWKLFIINTNTRHKYLNIYNKVTMSLH